MKTPIAFQPAKNPRLENQAPLPRVHGFQTHFGLAVHRSVETIRREYGYWDVSEPVTGCLVASGDYPGPEGAIAGLVRKVMQYRNRPGGFRGAMERARRRIEGETGKAVRP